MPRVAREPLPLRWAAIGACIGALIGGLTGLIVGLTAHWQTAWFAVFELGIPATFAGLTLGVVSGGIAVLLTRLRHRSA